MTLPLQTLSVGAAAAHLGISHWTLQRWVRRQLIRPLKTGGHPRYTVRELDRFLEANTRAIRD